MEYYGYVMKFDVRAPKWWVKEKVRFLSSSSANFQSKFPTATILVSYNTHINGPERQLGKSLTNDWKIEHRRMGQKKHIERLC